MTTLRGANAVSSSHAWIYLCSLGTLCRPHQWIKNLVVLAVGITLADGDFPVGHLTAATAAFCLTASAVYVLNDLFDVERDRCHPTKRMRPLASGKVSTSMATLMMVVLLTAGLGLAVGVNWAVFGCLVAYPAVNVAYSLQLKHVPIADVVAVSSGFVLRALAGAFAVGAIPHPYVLAAVCCGSFALILGKRRSELAAGGAIEQRPSLRGYSIYVLDTSGLVAVTAGVVMYLSYVAPSARTPAQSTVVAMLVMVVLAAIVRYLQIALLKDRAAENPSRLVLRDSALRGLGLGWAALSAAQVVLQHAHL
jgi:decaprenyl-phosphate phosphoribosyltransferase